MANPFKGKNDPRNGRGRGPKKGAPNAGRPKSEVRKALLMAADKRLPFLTQIADGDLTRTVLIDGEAVEIEPTVGESLKAMELMYRYGLGTQDELTGKDGEPLLSDADRTAKLKAILGF